MRWRIEQIDELDDGELDKQKCTQKTGILPRPKSDKLSELTN